jgi:DNA-binding SARP family transcriptional activator
MSSLRIRLLGAPTTSIGENPVFQESHTKAQALLYYLVTKGRTHYRNELASLFWPDVPDVQALKNLRNILPALRSRAGAHILITRHTMTFNRYNPYWLDVEAFEALLRVDPSQVGTAELWEAVALYNDDFLSGFYVRNAPLFEEWMLLKRERLRDMFIEALQTLAIRHVQQQDYHTALTASRRLLAIAPWHETGHRQQMQAFLGLGQRSNALAQYHICCRILASEFQVSPNNETNRVYEQIKATSCSPDNSTAAAPEETIASSHPPDLRPRSAQPVQPIALSAASTTAPVPAKPPSLPLALSADGALLAAPDTHDLIRLESLVTNRRLHWLSGHSAAVTALDFSPDGRILASASADQTVRLWDTASGALLATLIGHGAAVTALDFSPDGRILASASADQTVRLWDTASGMLHTILHMHRHPVVQVAFVPDGTRLVSIDSSRTVLHWHLLSRYSVQFQALPVTGETFV